LRGWLVEGIWLIEGTGTRGAVVGGRRGEIGDG
jgi:hypothetical protein